MRIFYSQLRSPNQFQWEDRRKQAWIEKVPLKFTWGLFELNKHNRRLSVGCFSVWKPSKSALLSSNLAKRTWVAPCRRERFPNLHNPSRLFPPLCWPSSGATVFLFSEEKVSKRESKGARKDRERRKRRRKEEALFLFNLPVETGELSLGRRAV